MRKVIVEELKEIEARENVRILHAVESGSRAWGFASPDSDYDVRFIYVRPREFYLKLERTRDVLEYHINDLLDINGWDLLRIKMEVPELKLIPRVDVINSYIESELPRICEEIKELSEEKLHGYDELNEMFLKYIW